MNKVGLIISREYLTRVRKKSFIIMTFLGPLLTILIYAVPILMALNGRDLRTVAVIDQTGKLAATLKSDDEVKYVTVTQKEEEVKQAVIKGDYDGLLVIPPITPENTDGVKLISNKNLPVDLVNDIKNALADELRNQKLASKGITQAMLDELEVRVPIDTRIMEGEEGKEKDSSSVAATVAGFASAFLIYMFVFLYGVQVMRGVIEEKTNRVVEVMISSVKPFELMMGKVVGIALVGLTQFAVWVLLTWGIGTVGMGIMASVFKPDAATSATNAAVATKQLENMTGQSMSNSVDSAKVSASGDSTTTAAATPATVKASPIEKIQKIVNSLDFTLILSCFLFFFIGGYLLYGSLFAAVGSAVDNETDTQQFMLPITIPLVVGFMIASSAINDPESVVAIWASIIPFTSPIVMMVRIPFGVPAWQIAASMVSLVVAFVACIWLAGRIYRVGILMYGKKPSFKELGKWLFYKI